VERLRTARNIAIVLLIAGAVYAIPGGGRAAATFEAVLLVGFGVAVGYLGLWFYRENRVALHGLGERHRALLYGALALALGLLIGRARMWASGTGELAWFVLVGLVVYAVLAVYRRWRAY
jgi:hypothetical protein